MSESEANEPTADEPEADEPTPDVDVVPRIRRGRGIRINSTDVFRIASVAILLVGIIALQRPCADGVASFVTSMEHPDAGPAPFTDDDVDGGVDLGELRMLTDDEIRDVFDNEDGAGAEKLLNR